jgi:hypothetical protein
MLTELPLWMVQDVTQLPLLPRTTRVVERQSYKDFIKLWLYSPSVGTSTLFSFLIFYTVGRTSWMGDQAAARPLVAHTGQHKHIINKHKLPRLKWDSNPRSQRLSEKDSSCLRPCGHCDQQWLQHC